MAHPIQPTVKLAQVEVFRTQALLTHQVTLSLAQEQSEVELAINELPLAMLDNSVRLAPSEPGIARVMDIHIGLATNQIGDLIRTTNKQAMVDLIRQKMRLALAHKHESSLISYLESLQPNLIAADRLPEQLAFQKRSLDSWQSFSTRVCQQLRTRRAKRREIERQQIRLDEQIHQAGLELENENQRDQEVLAVLRKACRSRIQLLDATSSLQLTLSYLVRGAHWVPEYEFRVYQDRAEAELVLKALVAQSTGQDWHQVPFAFSTSDLNRSTELPTLDSWRISKVQAERYSSWRPVPQGLDELFVAYDQSKKSAEPIRQHQLPNLPTLPPVIEPAEELLNLPFPQSGQLQQQVRIKTRTSEAQPELSDLAKELEDEEADFEITVQEPYPSNLPTQPPQERIPALRASREGASLMSVSFGQSNVRPRSQKSAKLIKHKSQSFPPQVETDETIQLRQSTLEASEQALAYDTLRMQGADQAKRGQLTSAGAKERFLEEFSPDDADLVKTLSHIPHKRWEDTLGQTSGSSHLLEFPQDHVRIDDSIGHFCVRYPMEGLGSVSSDGKLHSCSLLRKSEQFKSIYRCVPAIGQQVYQMVEFQNTLQVPLLAGPMRVYRQSDFVVQTPLATTPPGKKLTVNLGVEPAVTVARNTHFKESSDGLFGGDTALEHKVEIQVHSNLPSPIQIEVLERIPTSDDPAVKVEMQKTNPVAKPYDQTDRGQPIRKGLCFRLTLKPHTTQTCEMHYRIIMPKKHVLQGGNRRD